MPNDATRPQPSAKMSNARDFPRMSYPRYWGRRVPLALSLESDSPAALLCPENAPFRLQTLATEGSQLKANPAKPYWRQDRYSPGGSAGPVQGSAASL